MSYGIRRGVVITLPLYLPAPGDLLCHPVPEFACLVAWPTLGQASGHVGLIEGTLSATSCEGWWGGRPICTHIRPFVCEVSGEDE